MSKEKLLRKMEMADRELVRIVKCYSGYDLYYRVKGTGELVVVYVSKPRRIQPV